MRLSSSSEQTCSRRVLIGGQSVVYDRVRFKRVNGGISALGLRRPLVNDLLIVSDRNLARLTALRPHEQLQRELDRAAVVSSEAVPPDVVTMGSRVRYVDEAT